MRPAKREVDGTYARLDEKCEAKTSRRRYLEIFEGDVCEAKAHACSSASISRRDKEGLRAMRP